MAKDRRKLSSSIATDRLDRSMDSSFEAYQGILTGTRIATAGFAMDTAGLGCPTSLGLDVVSGLPAGLSRISGRPLVDCNPGTWCSRGRARGRGFDHAQSVNFRPNPTPRGGHSLCEHWRCRFGPGSPRPRHLFFMNGARRDRVDGIKDFNIRQKWSAFYLPALPAPGTVRI